jgi:cytochrome c oxidase cbb3-type subunit 3
MNEFHLTGIAIVLLALAVAPIGAQGPAQDSGAVARGKSTFSANCAFCHGSQAMGTEQAPNLLRSPLLFQDKNGDVLGPFLRQGRPTLGMPSFAALSPSQISDIVAFLHARLVENRSKRLPETAMLVGDAKAGQAFFNGDGKCNTCHSPTGDLAGIGNELQPLALTTAFLTPPAKPLQVSVTLPSGKMISGTLKYMDEFNVALVDSSGTYHSWQRESLKSVEVTDPLAAHKQLLPQYTDTQIHNLLAYLVTLK